MAAEWTAINLGAVCSKIGSGATPRGGGDVYLERGPYTLIRSQNVHNDGFHHDGLAHISEQHARELDGVEVMKGDVLLNITGDSVARVCQVDPLVLPARVNQHVAIIRPDPKRLDPRFLRYFLVSPDMQVKLLSWAGSGGTRNALTKGMIESFDVPAPDNIVEQRAIAHILGALDDKIELNRKMSEALEAMAQTLFNYWFVDIDHEIVKAQNLIDEGVLEIGDGYRAKNSELGKPGVPFIRAGDLSKGFDTDRADFLHESSVSKVNGKMCRPGDVAFTSKGTIGRFARVARNSPRFVYSPQVCFWRSLDSSRLEPSILYLWMMSDDFLAQLMSVAGQTDMAPYVSLQDQRHMLVPRFRETQHHLARQITPILDRITLLSAESRALTELRNALLPKLVSGDIRISRN